MTKPKTSIQEPTIISVPDDVVFTTLEQESSAFASLKTSLAEIRKLEGVIGYILRSDTSAVIDLNNPDNLVEYAMLATQMLDSSIEITKQFELGQIESVLVEGKNVKVLCMVIGENKISVFMEKSATHAGMIKRILL